jgi:hypothetical protein
MRLRIQLGGWLVAPLLLAGLAMTCAAQAQHQNDRPPKATAPKSEHAAANKPARQEHPSAQENRPPNRGQNSSRGNSSNAPRNAPRNAPPEASRADSRNVSRDDLRNNAGRDPRDNARNDSRDNLHNDRVYAPPSPPRGNAANRPPLNPQQQQREMRDRAREWRQLPPQQRQEMRERARVWGQMTPQQQNHIKNDVLPRWKEMPPDRRRAIQNRLGVLQNMPESARNQHLNDPNFTRGMSEEDRATLHDLSHLHVGGAPDPPGE